MKILNNMKTYTIGNQLKIDILESGDVFKIYKDNLLINYLKGNLIDGMASNIYLKNIETGEFKPLLGLKSNSEISLLNDHVLFEGNVLGVNYRVVLEVVKDVYYYHLKLKGKGKYVVYFYQDIGVNDQGVITNNEAYNAQYIDHQVFKTKFGFTTISKQNQGIQHCLQIGSNYQIDAYSTDMIQFFGLDYKCSQEPKAIVDESLPSEIVQYEMPLIALKTEEMFLGEKEFSFYGKYFIYNESNEIPYDVEVPFYNLSKEIKKLNFKKANISHLHGDDFNKEELLKYDKECLEEKDDKIYSFFSKNKHYVLKEKEKHTERPHGHLMMSGDILNAGSVFSVTNFMYGVFASRIVLGNTNFHRLTGDVRNPLNLQTISGMRFYIYDGVWRLLSMPSLYAVSANETKWIYKYKNDLIEIKYKVALNDYKHQVVFSSKENRKYKVLVLNQIVLGDEEYKKEINLVLNKSAAIFDFKNNDFVNSHYPNLKYKFTVKEAIFGSDEVLFGKQSGMGLFSILLEDKNYFEIDIEATLDKFNNNKVDFKVESQKYETFMKDLINLELNHNDENLKKFEKIIYWYTHNALVHYASPHGLEQTSGAAWGTRDVLQGPIELFTALRRFDLVRAIILKVYSRQFTFNYSWPQWFMYDKYYHIQAHDAHGDIIVWGLKAIAEYILNTNDVSILLEEVTYFSIEKNDFTIKETILEHLKNQIVAIKKDNLAKTSLPKYGGGDWNDTLQPKNQTLKDKMASAWTTSLLYESVTKLSEAIKEVDKEFFLELKKFQERLYHDYHKYLIVDNLPVGFMVIDNEKTPLLHPKDNKTNVKYRLLSLQRAIISNIISEKNKKEYFEIIKKNLLHKDGAKLMEAPIIYNHGKQTYFTRAETAANFGREVGIMYVHAHLRYVEALLKNNFGKEALRALLQVLPIKINEVVPLANIRQSNLYFSSSDAAFNNRFEAQEKYQLVKNGEIKVKSGWRLYSSGPGIFIHQFINNLLGIKQVRGELIIDPKYYFNDLTIKFMFKNKNIQIIFKRGEANFYYFNNKKMNKRTYINIKENELLENNEIVIYYKDN